MFQDAVHIFKKMGLKSGDVQILLACLSRKDGLFVAEITEITNIKRSTVYLSLKRLMEHGYITKSRIGNRWKYFSEEPESLLARQEMVVDDLKGLVPILKKLNSSEGKTRIRFYEGSEGIRKAYESVLISLKFAQECSHHDKEKKNLLAFVSGVHAQNIFKDWQKQFITKRKNLGCTYKMIAPKKSQSSPHYTNDDTQLREARYIDDAQFPFKIVLEIYADSIFIYSPIEPIGGVIISNEQISDSLRVLFLFVWSNLKREGE